MTAETLKWFYIPGSIVWNSHKRRYELVLKYGIFATEHGSRGWYAKVVPCTDKGIPCGNIYKHSISPTQDCFDGTGYRIHGGKVRFGVISPETEQNDFYEAVRGLQNHRD